MSSNQRGSRAKKGCANVDEVDDGLPVAGLRERLDFESEHGGFDELHSVDSWRLSSSFGEGSAEGVDGGEKGFVRLDLRQARQQDPWPNERERTLWRREVNVRADMTRPERAANRQSQSLESVSGSGVGASFRSSSMSEATTA